MFKKILMADDQKHGDAGDVEPKQPTQPTAPTTPTAGLK